MRYYVYIIKSLQDDGYYKGFSFHSGIRLQQHNKGESKYTLQKTPWVLVYVEACITKIRALQRERNLKKYSHAQIEGKIVGNKISEVRLSKPPCYSKRISAALVRGSKSFH